MFHHLTLSREPWIKSQGGREGEHCVLKRGGGRLYVKEEIVSVGDNIVCMCVREREVVDEWMSGRWRKC